MSSLTRIPGGVQYFFDDEARRRRYVERCAMEVFAGWSYDEILLPMFDYHDLFSRGMGVDRAERTYRFVDRDGALLALRPEMTTLVARTVATRFTRKPRPLRLCYSGEVFRYDEPARRGTREFHQVGIEHTGSRGIGADLEVLLIAAELLDLLALNDFRITLSHVDFFKGMASDLSLADAGRVELRELIDRRNGREIEAFLTGQSAGRGSRRWAEFCNLIRHTGMTGLDGVALRELCGSVEGQSREAISYLAEVHDILRQLGLGQHFAIDLGETANLDYYPGLTFKAYVPNRGGEIGGGEIGSGGRYDKLIANFGGAEPAIGFSFSLDGLAGAIAQRESEHPWKVEEAAETIDCGDDPAAAFDRARVKRRQKKRVKIGEK